MRKPRIIKEGWSYHITARINRQEFLFKSDEIKELLMGIIRRAKKKYHFLIKNFCIMENHVHFILKPLKGENLSRIMQWILSVFAGEYNRKFGLKGHVWYDRFRSTLIVSFQQYINTFIYIVNNPVKAGIVQNSVEYKYSGIANLHQGIIDIMERPPDRILRKICKIMNIDLNYDHS